MTTMSDDAIVVAVAVVDVVVAVSVMVAEVLDKDLVKCT